MQTKDRSAEMTMEIGQLFMAGMPGTSMDPGTETLIRDYNLGGIVLFSRNINDPVQVARLCGEIQETASKYHQPPLFLAVDQEGGRVARLRSPFTEFDGNQAIGSDRHPSKKALEYSKTTAQEMKMVGLNMNFAPVLDVGRGAVDKHLKGRLFGHDSKTVGKLGRIVIQGLQQNGVMAVAKHFPGLGRAETDPHFYLPRILADRREIEEINLPPFKEARDAGVSALMTSHAIYPALDPDHPATMSLKVLTHLIRNEMAFEGLIITDDLEMGAIANKWGVVKGAAAAFEAGADILLICEDQKKILESIQYILKRVSMERAGLNRLTQSHKRIQRVKDEYLSPGLEISLPAVSSYFAP